MKKTELKAGMIVKSSLRFHTNITKAPYHLILFVDTEGYGYLDSPDPKSFYVLDHMSQHHTSFHHVGKLILVR